LWADTDVSEEHATSIFKIDICRFRSRRVTWKVAMGPKERVYRKEPNSIQWEEINKTKNVSYKGHTGLLSQVRNRIMRKDRPFQVCSVIFGRNVELGIVIPPPIACLHNQAYS
jgi:hypothetical protein